MSSPTFAREFFEDYLREQIRYNIEHNILPSENAVAGRMLSRGDELTQAYDEIHTKLRYDTIAMKVFANCVLSAGIFEAL